MKNITREFHVIGAPAIRAILSNHESEIIALVRETYLLHCSGRTVNPGSYFLRFEDKPAARIIALPARVQATRDISGIKWISSFPENRERNIERASAVIVLNDMETGHPYACLEGSHISAARTAASATLAAESLHKSKDIPVVAVIGAGPIAKTVVNFMLATGWNIGSSRVHDLIASRADALCAYLHERKLPARISASPEDAIRGADLVVFATTAAAPHMQDPTVFTPGQTVLHLSLRDLGVSVILSAQNIVDDVDHCLKAQTSVHLAEQATNSRAFIAGTIGDMLTNRLLPNFDQVRVFSPFGLGILDLSLARFVYEKAVSESRAVGVKDFFG
jgi:2,3-diaminopropionate biosynthesis protein SbnB